LTLVREGFPGDSRHQRGKEEAVHEDRRPIPTREGVVVGREGENVEVVHASGFHVVLARHDDAESEWPLAHGPFALHEHAEGAAGHLRTLGWECEVAPMWGGDTEATVAIPGIEV
jgi:hypothetical protein